MDEYIKREDALDALMFELAGSGYQSRARDVIRFLPAADVAPRAEVKRLEREIKALLAFKDYFSDLYGHGLEIANWHENGELEYFDMFYESAVDEYESVLKNKYTGG